MDVNDSTIADYLIAHVAHVAGIDAAALSTETPLYDVGLDSILLAIILRDVEVRFAVLFEDEEIAAFLGASRISEYIDILRLAVNRRASTERTSLNMG